MNKQAPEEVLIKHTKRAVGRPTSYTEEILLKTIAYVESCNDTEEDKESGVKAKVNLPSIEGLAYEIKVNRDNIYEWCKTNKDFSDIIDDLRAKQARTLLNKGLSGEYNSTIAKVLLTKHGYREGIETTDKDGEPLNNNIADAIAKAYGNK